MIELTIPRPRSTKNSRKLIRVGRNLRSIPGEAAERSKRQFLAALIEAIGRIPHEPLFGDDDVRVVTEHLVDTDELHIRFESAGPRPKRKRTGRRSDLQNVLEGPLDWAAGLVYRNDNQIVEVVLRRTRD